MAGNTGPGAQFKHGKPSLIRFHLFLMLALSKGPNRVGVFPHLKPETDPVSETSCPSVFLRILDYGKVRNPSNYEMSHLSVQTELDSFFKPALLRSETSTTSESSIDE
jgi:hypothetical protein